MEPQESRIHILDSETANQIAAGEVVERPVSVVKELVENAIDAGARRITVSIEQNPAEDCIKKIQVIDDGMGMSRADLETAFYRHATSKIQKISDLDKVVSLGFRGEALPSIASVSKVSVQSRAAARLSGYMGQVVDGQMVITGESGMPPGTKITVEDLFYHTPARKKFLKSMAVEQGKITKLLGDFILSAPEIAFILKVDGRTVLHSSGNGDLRQAVLAVYGAANLANLAPVRYAQEGIVVDGLVSRPPFSRSNRKYYHFFVNGRLVKSRDLSTILELAYETLLPERRYPMAILYLRLDPASIDVNVHPAKTEIRFHRLAAVKEVLLAAVKEALAPKIAVEPQKTVAVPKKAVSRVQENLKDLEIQGENGKTFRLGELFQFAENDALPASEMTQMWRQTREEAEEVPLTRKAAESEQSAFAPKVDMKASPQSEFTSKLFERLVQGGKADEEESVFSMEKTDEIPNPFEIYNEYLGYYDEETTTPRSNPLAGLGALFQIGALPGKQPVEAEQAELFPQEENLFRALRPLGQLNASYVIAVYGEDLYIIDQHAAHERILYETFAHDFEQHQNAVSLLAVPVSVELGNLSKELLLQNLEAVTDFGFVVEYLGDSTFVLRGVPLWFAQSKDNENVRRSEHFRQSAEEFFLDMMDRIVGNAHGEENAVSKTALNKEELFTMACKNAVKANDVLTDADIHWLLSALATAEHPQTCPHGRPTVIRISNGEIRKRFMRS